MKTPHDERKLKSKKSTSHYYHRILVLSKSARGMKSATELLVPQYLFTVRWRYVDFSATVTVSSPGNGVNSAGVTVHKNGKGNEKSRFSRLVAEYRIPWFLRGSFIVIILPRGRLERRSVGAYIPEWYYLWKTWYLTLRSVELWAFSFKAPCSF